MVQLYGRVGGETLVNTTTAENQTMPAMVRLGSGGFVVVWVSQPAPGSPDAQIRAQLYAADGTPVGGEFLVSPAPNAAFEPRVAALSTGGFIVTWTYDVHDGTGSDGTSPFAYRIQGQIFDSAGAKVGGELAIGPNTTGDHVDSQVIALANGAFAVSWTLDTVTNNVFDRNAVVQVFNAAGAPISALVTISAATAGAQFVTALTALPGGGFVATWADTNSSGLGDSSGSAVKAQLFDSAGAKVGGEFRVNTTTLSAQSSPSVAPLESGGFVVTWSDNSRTGGDTSGQAVRGQIFNAAGAKVGGELLVNTATAGDQILSSVASLPGGGFVVAWRDGPLADADIKAQVFDSAGAKVGIEFRLNSVTSGPQTSPVVITLADGSVVAAWTDQGGSDGSLSGIKMQILAPGTAAPSDIALSNATLSENAFENDVVGTLSTVGAANSGFTYELIGDSTGGAFRLEGDRLIVNDNARLDFETSPQATVTIRTTDINGQTHVEALVLDVTDIFNEKRYSAGDEFLANVTETGLQGGSTVVPLASGGFAMFWLEYNPANPSPSRTMLRLYGADGVPVSDETAIAGNWLQGMQVVPLASGGFLIVREAYHEPAGTFSIKAQAFDPSGSPTGAEMTAGATQSGFPHHPTAVQLSTGGYAISWAAPGDVVLVRLFNAGGAPLGGPIPITSSFEDLPISLAATPSGGFAAGWVQGGVGDDPFLVKAQLYGANGALSGPQVSIDAGTLGVGSVNLLALAAGDYMLTWVETIGDIDGFPVNAVMAQPLDSSGAAVGGPIALTLFATEPDFSPAISFAAHPDGGFVAMWPMIDPASDPATYSFHGQLFDNCGCPIGETFHPTPVGEGGDIAVLADGTIVTTWTGFDSDDRGIGVRLYRPADEPFDNSGDDILWGDLGPNLLDGGPGDDQLFGFGGDDELIGGEGDDLLQVSYMGHATADGGSGFDTLLVDYAGATTGIVMGFPNNDLGGGHYGSLGDGADRLVDYTGIEAFDIRTGTGDDVVYGAILGTTANLGGGDDRFWGLGGLDIVDGGAGVDGVSAPLGLSTAIVWNLATNRYSGPIGSYTNFEYFLGLNAGEGNDTIVTTSANLDDLMALNGGNDSVTVANGHDTVFGHQGIDLLIVDYSAATASVTTTGGAAGLTAGTQNSGLKGQISDGGTRRVDFDDIDRFDVRSGSGADDIATGGGNDLLNGGTGADTMRGGAGNDVYFVDNAGDTIVENGGEGTDEIRTSLTSYSLVGLANVESLTGLLSTGQSLTGNVLSNRITGGAGNDNLYLTAGGNDTALGGAGNDAFFFGSKLTNADTVRGGAGYDTLVIQGNYAGGLGLDADMSELEALSILAGSNTALGEPGTNRYDYVITTHNANFAAGLNVKVNGSALLAGEDFTFNGSAETDASFTVYGGRGVDSLTGGLGNDVIVFAEGRFGAGDSVNGGGGFDALVLRGPYAIDLSAPGHAGLISNIENITLSSASDERYARGGGTEFDYNIILSDSMVGVGQALTVSGSLLMANETMVVVGSQESNATLRLFGGASVDTLIGGGGDDLIHGNLGGDDMTGGGGVDTFRYQSTAESTEGSVDIIQDFRPGTDRIDLGGIDANSHAAGNQAFTWIGSNGFSGLGAASAGELRTFQSSGIWYVQGDTDGDGDADLFIGLRLEGPTPLGPGDFLL